MSSERTSAWLSLLANSRINHQPQKLTDEVKSDAVIGKAVALSEEESRSEATQFTSDDIEQEIVSAVELGRLGKIGLNAEHPTATVFRLGIATIQAGKPSPLFLSILELIGQAADSGKLDVLKSIASKPHRGVERKTLKAAKLHKYIADEFRNFVLKGTQEGKTFSEIKMHPMNGFFAYMDSKRIRKKTVERALSEHGLNWEAKKTGRPKK